MFKQPEGLPRRYTRCQVSGSALRDSVYDARPVLSIGVVLSNFMIYRAITLGFLPTLEFRQGMSRQSPLWVLWLCEFRVQGLGVRVRADKLRVKTCGKHQALQKTFKALNPGPYAVLLLGH